jgi:hypothetical protein
MATANTRDRATIWPSLEKAKRLVVPGWKRYVNVPSGAVVVIKPPKFTDTPPRAWPPFVATRCPVKLTATGGGGGDGTVGEGVVGGVGRLSPHPATDRTHSARITRTTRDLDGIVSLMPFLGRELESRTCPAGEPRCLDSLRIEIRLRGVTKVPLFETAAPHQGPS